MIERPRAGRSNLTALVALLALAGLLSASPALGADEHPYLPALHLEGLEGPCGTATDSYGNLYVAGYEGTVGIYDPAGALLTEFLPGEISAVYPCGIAVDRAGAVYLAGFGIPSERKVIKFAPGEFPPTASTEYELDESAGDEGVIVDGGAEAVAVDPDTGDVYVTEGGTNEVQRLGVPPVAQCTTPGTKLVFVWTPTGEVGTTEVPCGASQGATQVALEDLLGPGNVEVLLGETLPNTYRIRLIGELGNTDFPVGVLETREAGGGPVKSTSTAQPNVNGAPSKISIYESDGTPIPGAIGTGVSAAVYYGVDVDAGSGRVFAVDVQSMVVDVFDPSVSKSTPSETIDGSENPNFPSGFDDLTEGFVAVDQTTGNFFVNNVGYSYFGHPNEGNGVIAQFAPDGDFVSQVGPTFGDDGLEFESEIAAPIGLTVDDGLCSPNRGNVYVANWENVYAFGPTSPFTPAAPAVTAVDPSAGPTAGGDTVTVTGTELGCADLPGGAVEFGATTATGVDVNAAGTELTATAPAHAAGTVDVTVTTAAGTSASGSASEYTYVAAPAVTAISPDRGPLEAGTVVTVTGTGLAGAEEPAGAVKFGAVTATDVDVNPAGTELTAVAPAGGAGPAHVTVTTIGGTSATSADDEYTYVSPPALTVVEAGTGSGSVECNGGPCEATYPYGTSVTLAATTAADSTFAGFSGGGCSGAGSCTVVVEAQTTVTATFDLVPQKKEQGAGQTPPPPGDEEGAVIDIAPAAQVKGGTARVNVSCLGPGPCKGTIRLTAKVKIGKKTKTIVVGTASYEIPAGSPTVVKVKLSAAARKRLKKGALKVRVRGAVDGTVTLKLRG